MKTTTRTAKTESGMRGCLINCVFNPFGIWVLLFGILIIIHKTSPARYPYHNTHQ